VDGWMDGWMDGIDWLMTIWWWQW